MSLRKLPPINIGDRPQNYSWDTPTDVFAQWASKPLAASTDNNEITIYDVIGQDWYTGEGFTAKRAAGALRAIGNKDVVVNINSPGGDMFEGIAIYNLLQQHPAKVTVNVMGWAASAASIIAMAADEVVMGLGSFVMIHNAWGAVVGNQHDFRAAADTFKGFDSALNDIYQARTGLKSDEIAALMDGESFIGAIEAVDKGFADRVDNDLAAAEASNSAADKTILARRKVEATLASAGHTRASRQNLLADLMSAKDGAPRDATPQPAARDAGINTADIYQLIQTMKS